VKLRTTLILLVLVLALGAFLVLVADRQPTSEEYLAAKYNLFPPTEWRGPADPMQRALSEVATMLRLEKDAHVLVAFRDDVNSPWRVGLSEPGGSLIRGKSFRADPKQIATILDAVEALRAITTIVSEDAASNDQKEYGLGASTQSIAIGTDEKHMAVSFGDRTPDGNSIYAIREGLENRIYVVADGALVLLDLSVNQLRDKMVFRADWPKVDRVELVRATTPPLVCRKTHDDWRLEQPIADRANNAAMMHWFRGLAGIEIPIEDLLDEDGTDTHDDPYGFGSPALTLSLQQGETATTLLVGKESPGNTNKYYAKLKGEPGIFLLPAQVLDTIPRRSMDLRTRQALHFDPTQVSGVEIEIADGPESRLAHRDGVWQMLEPKNITPDTERVEIFFADLLDLHIERWIDNPTETQIAECGLKNPQAVVTLFFQDGSMPQAIHFGNLEGSGILCSARMEETGPIVFVPTGLLKALREGPNIFVAKTVLRFDPTEAQRLRIVRPGDAIIMEYDYEENLWQITQPVKTKAKAIAVSDLLWNLCRLEAKSVVAERADDLSPYGLDRPRLTVGIRLKSEPNSETILLIGSETEHNRVYAMVEGKSRVFAISKTIADSAMTGFADEE